jgi:DNA primase
MKFHGREIDVVGLWENYVDFSPNMNVHDTYLPLVRCPNPAHDTLKRHFQINAADGLVHCFANCGISGSFLHAISVVEGFYDRYETKRQAYRAAERIILGYQGKTGSQTRISRTKPETTRALPEDLSYDTFIPQFGLEYLEQRGISAASIAKWELGWNGEERRIVIPAKDFNGTTRFLIRRAIRPQDYPKYLYTEGFPKSSLLFGACHIDPGMVRSDGLILVEGSVDAIIQHQHGLQNTGATLGTGISFAQSRLVASLRPRRVYLFYDRDVAGIHGIQISYRRLRRLPLYVCRYPRDRDDPAQLTTSEAYRAVERAVPISKFFRQAPSARPVQ